MANFYAYIDCIEIWVLLHQDHWNPLPLFLINKKKEEVIQIFTLSLWGPPNIYLILTKVSRKSAR